ncbi:phage tail assembly protein [Burkholderia alba]|uniref:phage tail assembly protein n=1 Tax=Burkholderia alba TaxID=2683677 RepID=UPI002B05EE40|nr:phage tail assembly protein [Burkholderia alba]
MAAPKKIPDYLKYSDTHVDITLSHPAELSGTKTAVLRMRAPTVADQLAIGDLGAGESELALLANLCEIVPSDLHGLRLRDYQRLQAAFLGFLD